MTTLKPIALLVAVFVSSNAAGLTVEQIDYYRSRGELKTVLLAGTKITASVLEAYLLDRCQSDSLHVFRDTDPSSTPRSEEVRGYSCTLNGGPHYHAPYIFQVQLQNENGFSILNDMSNGNSQYWLDIRGGRCNSIDAKTDYDNSTTRTNYVCTASDSGIPDIGILDGDINVINQPPNLPDTISGDPTSTPRSPANLDNITALTLFQRVFGVAVNNRAFLALQKSQGLASVSATQPDDDPTKRPSLSTSFVRAMLTGGLSASATTQRGWGMVIDAFVDSDVHKKAFNICRHQPGHGTQALSNIYFAQNPCGAGEAATILRQPSASQPAPLEIGGYNVMERSNSANTESCLSAVEAKTGAYGLAVLGLESDKKNYSLNLQSYRFIKLDGMQPAIFDSAIAKGAATGHYDFVFSTVIAYNSERKAGDVAFADWLVDFRNRMNLSQAYAGNLYYFMASQYVNFPIQDGVMTSPIDWQSAGQYPVISSTFKKLISRVARNTGNNSSCSALKYVR